MKAFISNFFSAVSNNLISGGAYYLIAKGILVTFIITVLAWIIATVLGVLISYLMCYEKKVWSIIGRCLCFFFRSVPLPITLWLFYYCIFGNGKLNATIVCALSIGLYGAGLLSEIVSDSAMRVEKGLSDNLKGRLEGVYYRLVVPQAAEESMYQLKRLAQQLLAWSAVAGYIGVNDLTEVMYGIGQRTMYPFFSLFFSAICYMLANLLIEWVFSIIKKKTDKKDDNK